MHNNIVDYYNHQDEDNRLITRHGQVEFLTTMRYIEKYLYPGARVIEIGAATGRYSHAIAKQGYMVDAVELVPYNIEIFQKNTIPGETVTIQQGDARNLSMFADNTYDSTLLLGPLYHLYTLKDKQQVIGEALRVTKPGGIVSAAYCLSDATIIEMGFKQKSLSITEYMRLGKIDPVTWKTHSEPEDIFELIRCEDIDEIMRPFTVTRLHLISTDLYTNHMRDIVDSMDDETFAIYLNYHFAVCERQDMIGLSHHCLDVFKKS